MNPKKKRYIKRIVHTNDSRLLGYWQVFNENNFTYRNLALTDRRFLIALSFKYFRLDARARRVIILFFNNSFERWFSV